MWKRFYEGVWHHPGFAWVGGALAVLAFARTQRFILAWTALAFIETLLDSILTGGFSPVRGLPVERWTGITFVILGDLRLFLAVEWALALSDRKTRGFPPLRALCFAVPLAFVVPVLSTIPIETMPELFPQNDPYGLHKIFILYEAMFVVFALVLRFLVLPRRLAREDAETARWVKGLFGFFLVQYGLWVAADALILSTHADVGYLLRLAPNIFYYVLFVPFAYATSPRAWRDG